MNLYFIRHAIAVQAGTPEYENDSLRPLTDKGIKKMQKIARGLKDLGAEIDLIASAELWEDNPEPIYRIPFMPLFCVGFGAIAVGTCQRVLTDLKRRIRERQRVLYGVKEWESPIAQRNLADLLVKLDGIEALHERYVQDLERWQAANNPLISAEDSNRMGAWRSSICRQGSEIAFRAFEMLGGMAAYKGDPIEIAARDLFMVLIHVGQIYDDNMLAYGRTQYGLSGHPLL